MHGPRRAINQLLQQIAFLYILPVRWKVFLHQLRGVRFKDPKTAWIGDYVILDSARPSLIEIGKDSLITSGCKIYIHFYHKVYGREAKTFDRVRIGDGVFIGVNSVIVKPVNIGDGVVVGAGSVVTKDIPPNTMVGGVPAKPIKKLKPFHER